MPRTRHLPAAGARVTGSAHSVDWGQGQGTGRGRKYRTGFGGYTSPHTKNWTRETLLPSPPKGPRPTRTTIQLWEVEKPCLTFHSPLCRAQHWGEEGWTESPTHTSCAWTVQWPHQGLRAVTSNIRDNGNHVWNSKYPILRNLIGFTPAGGLGSMQTHVQLKNCRHNFTAEIN